jgi:hypothetical protein
MRGIDQVSIRLVKRDGFLAAEIVGEAVPRLTTEDVRAMLEQLRALERPSG